jgi:hypothetical protein
VFFKNLKLPIVAILVMICCIALVLLPLSADFNDKRELVNKQKELDQRAVGVVDRKRVRGENYYVSYHFEYMSDLRQRTASWVVAVDREMFDKISQSSNINILYSSKNVYISDIEGNNFVDVLQARIYRHLLLIGVFLSGVVLSVIYIFLIKKGSIK